MSKLVKESLNEDFGSIVLTAIGCIALWKLTWRILRSREFKEQRKMVDAAMKRIRVAKPIVTEYAPFLLFSYPDNDFRIKILKKEKRMLINQGNYNYTPIDLTEEEFNHFFEITEM